MMVLIGDGMLARRSRWCNQEDWGGYWRWYACSVELMVQSRRLGRSLARVFLGKPQWVCMLIWNNTFHNLQELQVKKPETCPVMGISSTYHVYCLWDREIDYEIGV